MKQSWKIWGYIESSLTCIYKYKWQTNSRSVLSKVYLARFYVRIFESFRPNSWQELTNGWSNRCSLAWKVNMIHIWFTPWFTPLRIEVELHHQFYSLVLPYYNIITILLYTRPDMHALHKSKRHDGTLLAYQIVFRWFKVSWSLGLFWHKHFHHKYQAKSS